MLRPSPCLVLLPALLLLPPACAAPRPDPELSAAAQAYLDGYTATYLRLAAESSEAQWASNTHIVEGDDTNAKRTQAADEALAAFTGSAENIEAARAFLEQRKELPELQVRQLERILFLAGDNPQTVPEVVKARIAAETRQNEALYGYTFRLDGAEITPNQIDQALREETDLARRRKVWEASKEVGKGLKDGLVELRRLRNESVRALGYPDFFGYMASEYGMTTAELAAQIETVNRELRPLYRELHTWARHELAARHGQPVPDLIPAHWLPNRWGQDWSALVEVEGFDLDA
ncbi:MAG TPA: M2 family metallopeptidase, partial [Planctomycetota bacterium]